jgi:hypothetical protein
MKARCRRRNLVLVCMFAVALLAVSSHAWARTLQVVPYPITSVWPASVRFLRVVRDYPIREKDESAGYILFDFTDGPKLCKASLELIPVTDSEGRSATRLVVTIPDLPRRYEILVIDKLSAKIRDDEGPPPPAPREPEKPKPDAAPPAPAESKRPVPVPVTPEQEEQPSLFR